MAKRKISNKTRQYLIGFIVFLIAGYVGWHKLGPYHFTVVEPGVLYRGGSQTPFNMEYLNYKIGFKSIVSLRQKDEGGWNPNWYDQETIFCKENNIRFYHIPMHGKIPPSDNQIKLWLQILSDKTNYPVYVHCAQGVTRTGIMVALYQIALQDKDPQKAWNDLPRFGHDFEKDSYKDLKEKVTGYFDAGLTFKE